jgi:hypothetical protein
MSRQWNRCKKWNGYYRSDFVVAYAKTDARVSGLTLQVEGGHFEANSAGTTF